jgi:hypothetical protein
MCQILELDLPFANDLCSDGHQIIFGGNLHAISFKKNIGQQKSFAEAKSF